MFSAAVMCGDINSQRQQNVRKVIQIGVGFVEVSVTVGFVSVSV